MEVERHGNLGTSRISTMRMRGNTRNGTSSKSLICEHGQREWTRRGIATWAPASSSDLGTGAGSDVTARSLRLGQAAGAGGAVDVQRQQGHLVRPVDR